MFNMDIKVRGEIAKRLQRVLLIDPKLATIRLLTDLLTDVGAEDRASASTTTRAIEVAELFNPQLILTELAGPDLNGVEFTRRLRTSSFACRDAPIIVLSAEATAAAIKAARDAGAHEFLCKPFTAGALYKRVENVMLKPRPWVKAKLYVGPDRRRFNSGAFEGEKRRQEDDTALLVA